MFLSNTNFWKRFSNYNDDCYMYYHKINSMIVQMKMSKVTVAATLQRAQSTIFNVLFYQTPNSIVRYDQIMVCVPQQDVDSTVQKISQYINSQFGYAVPLAIVIDQKNILKINNIDKPIYNNNLTNICKNIKKNNEIKIGNSNWRDMYKYK